MGWYEDDEEEDDEEEAFQTTRCALSGCTAALLARVLILSVLGLIWLGSGTMGFGPPG